MSKQFLAVIAVVILVFVGIVVITSNKSTTSTSNSTKPSEHIEGQGKSGVTLVEYGDYQCPYCGEYYPTLKQVYAEYSSQITFQFRNFPLVNLHPNAFAGARAAEAANLQGKFWQMHDILYEQNDLYYNSNETYATWINASDPLNDFDNYAKQLGLNVNQFNTDYASSKVNNVIQADMNAGNQLNIDATPTFILDGKQVQIGNSLGSFETLINAQIKLKASHAASKSS